MKLSRSFQQVTPFLRANSSSGWQNKCNTRQAFLFPRNTMWPDHNQLTVSTPVNTCASRKSRPTAQERSAECRHSWASFTSLRLQARVSSQIRLSSIGQLSRIPTMCSMVCSETASKKQEHIYSRSKGAHLEAGPNGLSLWNRIWRMIISEPVACIVTWERGSQSFFSPLTNPGRGAHPGWGRRASVFGFGAAGLEMFCWQGNFATSPSRPN